MTLEKFEKLVKEGIEAIPKRFLEKLDNIDIVIEEECSKGSNILGLYEGVPQTKRCFYGQVLPDKITIFKKSIEREAISEKEIKEIIKNTVWHEIAHHFGMSEEDISSSSRFASLRSARVGDETNRLIFPARWHSRKC